ncbi:MAG: DUF11 domain-containing protein [Holophagales bacterium]|nr:MAG: DUF11 domain-containing protein [Holophagales bacterium]
MTLLAMPLLGSDQSPPRLAARAGEPVAVAFREDRGHVAILDISGDYDFVAPDGSSNWASREAVGSAFFADHADAYDFLIVAAGFPVALGPGDRAHHLGVRNDIEGIGLPIFDQSDLFGSAGRLQSYVDLGELASYRLDSPTTELDQALLIATHELLHRWAARVSFRTAGGSPSGDLVTGEGHWSYLLASNGSVLYGNNWRDNGDGTFTSIDALKIASPLDLYLAGFLSSDEVPPFFLIRNPTIDPKRPARIGETVSGTRLDLSIEDVIAAEGPRVPAAAAAPRELAAALVYLVRPGDEVSESDLANLELLRRELMKRFAIQTAGRGRLEIHPLGADEATPGLPVPLDGGAIRPGAMVLADALRWLASRQSAEGYWQDREGTRWRDSAAVASSLLAAGGSFDLAGLVAWARAGSAVGTDAGAHRAALLHRLGAGSERSDQLALIGAAQRPDGGWGASLSYRLDPLDTVVALSARDGGAGDDAAVQRLVQAQNPDGSWGGAPGGSGRVEVTAAATRLLLARGRTSSAEAGLGWIAAHQNADGGFGDSPSTAHATAEALLVLRAAGRVGAIDEEAATAYLSSRQSVAGSWDGSVFTTARVVEALRQGELPNGVFSASLSAVPANPAEGESVLLHVRLRNSGSLPLPAGTVRFFDGLPEQGGVAISPDRVVPPLPAGGEVDLETNWLADSPAGPHVLVAIFDPEGSIIESDESDNRSLLTLEVATAPPGPDLEVRPEGISFSPSSPNLLPSTVTVTVALRNRGMTPVPAVAIQMWRGAPSDGSLVGEVAVAVGAGSTVPVSIPFDVTSPGAHEVTLIADPADQVVEAREDNNQASARVTTAPSVDLEVLASQITLLDPPYPGADVRFAVTLRNRGTLGSPAFTLRTEVVQGSTAELVSEDSLQLAAGTASTLTIPWRVSRGGSFDFRVVLDPLGLVPEVDEGNNSASLPFLAGAPSTPNLTISYRDLQFTPEPALEGAPLDLQILLRNTGGVEAQQIVVRAFDGNPAQGGAPIATVTVPSLAEGASTAVDLRWAEVPNAADRFIHLVVDPDNAISELDEADNEAFRRLDVLSLPDAAISPASLGLNPPFPVPGQSATLSIEIANLGEQVLEGLRARAFLRTHGDDEVPLVPDAHFAPVGGGRSGTAQVELSFDGSVASGELVVRVDPDAQIREGNEGNNQAALPLAVQDADAYMSERFFSPNSDGIKDTTVFSFRLDPAASVAVEILDRWGQTVWRESRPEWSATTGGSFVWSGMTSLGRLARDGDYEVRAVAGDGSVLARAVTTLDTNRSSMVEASGTPYEAIENLTCSTPRPDELQLTADERWAYFLFRLPAGGVSTGIYRAPGNGGSLQPVVGPDWFAPHAIGDLPDEPSEMNVSASGALVAFTQSACLCGDCRHCGGNGTRGVFLANASGTQLAELPLGSDSRVLGFFDGDRKLLAQERAPETLVAIATSDPSLKVPVFASPAPITRTTFSPDRRRVLVETLGDAAQRQFVVNLETGSALELPLEPIDWVAPVWSDDGSLLALRDATTGEVAIFASNGELLQRLSIPLSPIAGGSTDAAIPLGFSTWNDELAIRVSRLANCEMWEEFFVVDLQSTAARSLGSSPARCHCCSFAVSAAREQGWEEIGRLHFSRRFDEESLDLPSWIGQEQGSIRLRIRNLAASEAQIESLQLSAAGERLSLVSAIETENGQETKAAIESHDGRLFEATGREIEAAWRGGRFGPLRLSLTAREDGAIPGVPAAETRRTLSGRNEPSAPFEWGLGGGPWVPNDRAVLTASSLYAKPLHAFGLDPGASPVELLADWTHLENVRLSPTRRRLLFESEDPGLDPESACFGTGPDLLAVKNWLNLGTELTARRVPGVGGVLLEGVAADRSFERFRLEYALEAPSPVWLPIAPPSAHQEFGGEIQSWIPPGPGVFRVRLVAEDKAGNTRVASARVFSSDTPVLTDLDVSPEVFSPNGDGALDQAVVSYRVLEPANLEFQFLDARGSAVRTFSRSHAIPGEFSFVWDGRDDAGTRVVDGRYRLRVLDFQQGVEVDTRAPSASLSLVAMSPSCRPDGLAPGGRHLELWYSLERSADDDGDPATVDDLEVHLERGLGQTPAIWEPIDLRSVSLDEEQAYRFRLIAIDRAGNRTSVSAAGPEPRVILGAASGQPSGQLIGPPGATQCDTFDVPENGLLRLEALNAWPTSLVSAEVRVPPSGECTGGLGAVFPVLATYQVGASLPWGFPLPDLGFEVLINASGLSPGRHVVCLRGLDSSGAAWEAESRIAVRGAAGTASLKLSGAFSEDVVRTGLDGENEAISRLYRQAISAEAIEEGDALFLLGTVVGSEEVEGLSLQVSSSADLRYTPPVRLAPVFGVGREYLFRVEAWTPCAEYLVRFEGWRVGGDGTRLPLTTGPLPFQGPCFSVEAWSFPEWAAECGGSPGGGILFESVARNYRGDREILLLTLGRLLEDGSEELWTSVNRPIPGATYRYRLDSSGFSEGSYRYRARVVNSSGEQRSWLGSFVVDRTPPTAEILYPLEGQPLCAKSFRVDHSLSDAGGLQYALSSPEFAGPPAPLPAHFNEFSGGLLRSGAVPYLCTAGCGRLPMPPACSGEEVSRLDRAWESPRNRRGNSAGSACTPRYQSPDGPVQSVMQTWRSEFPIDGLVAMRLEAVDWGGFRVCRERTVEVDGRPDGVVSLSGPSPFSPNGDGVFDATELTLDAGESLTANLSLYKASLGPGGWELSGPELRRLLEGHLVLDQLVVEWNGLDARGTVVSDGTYAIAVDVLDGCTNAGRKIVPVTVDNTSPAADLLYPRSGEPLPMLVNVRARTEDEHFLRYQLFVGVGAAPTTWELVAAGSSSSPDQILGTWNTYGLSGTYTLRLETEDSAGNRAEDRETLLVDSPYRILSYVEVVPGLFSPNGDGRRELTSLRIGVEVPAGLTVVIQDLGGTVLRRVVVGQGVAAGALTLGWDGNDDLGQEVPDGEYRVVVHAVLSSNPNVTQDEAVPLSVDRQAPDVTIRRPESGFVAGSGPVIGSIVDRFLTSYSVELASGVPLGPWSILETGSASRVDAPLGSLDGLPEGPHALRVRAEDAAENRIEQVLPFIVDNTPPQLAITAPAVGAIVGRAGDPIAIVGGVVEEHLAAWRLEVGVGASPSSWMPLTSGSELPLEPTLVVWAVAGLADGLYTLRLSATDQASLSSETRLVVTVDNTPPGAAILTPRAGDYVRGATPVVGSATDAHFVQRMLSVAPEGSLAFNEIGRSTTPVDDGNLAIWTALPPDGRYLLRLEVTDAADNRARVELPVEVDTHPPSAPTLRASLEGGRDARLHWTASPEPDVVGYELFRDGVKIPGDPLTATTALDTGLGDGRHVYVVRAVDRAGWRSGPSNEALVEVDRTPPLARILEPAAGARVSGVLEVRGTAWSAGDLREWRLSVVPLLGGTATLLARSTLPVEADRLADWATATLEEGSSHRLRLEAEDVAGNVGADEVVVTIDNLPPAPPTGLAAIVPGGSADVAVTWNANSEADLEGYLLYRDGALVNAGGGPAGDPRTFVIRTSSYSDRQRPDGTYTYIVLAMDQAGNLSGPSSPAEATVSRQAPHAVIVAPEDGASIGEATVVRATTSDQDVAEVRFRFRAVGVEDWTDLGNPDSVAPWEAAFTPESFVPPLPFGDYELEAVATDLGGLVDPGPSQITVTYADLGAPAAPLELRAAVDGGEVSLQWQASTEPDLRGYFVERHLQASEDWIRLSPDPVVTTVLVDSNVADGDYDYRVVAVDQSGNLSLPSNAVPAVVYTPRLRQPYTPTELRTTILAGRGRIAATIEGTLTNGAGTGPLPAIATGADATFSLPDIPLAIGDNTFSLRLVDGGGNRSKAATVIVRSGDRPAAPGGVAGVAGPGEHDVSLTWNANSEPDLLGYRLVRDGNRLPAVESVAYQSASASSSEGAAVPEYAIDADPGSYWAPAGQEPSGVAGQWLEVTWSEPRIVERASLRWLAGAPIPFGAADFDLFGWDGRAWVPLVEVRGNALEVTELRLPRAYRTDRLRVDLLAPIAQPDGSSWVGLSEVAVEVMPTIAQPSFTEVVADGLHAYAVTAWNLLGFESDPSASASVPIGDVEPPPPVILSATVHGSDVHLTWTPSTAPDVARYDLYRNGAKLVEHVDLDLLVEVDVARPNGTYTYEVRPIDAVGNLGAFSNAVVVVVNVVAPAAPLDLMVTEVAEGRALDLRWSPPAGGPPPGYRLYRGVASGGPFEAVAVTSETTRRDLGLVNGTTYFYRVVALDVAGNESLPSNEASGTPHDHVVEAPILLFPTVAGRSLIWASPIASVAGLAEPDSSVALFRDGQWVGAARATAAETDVPAGPGVGMRLHLAPDGRRWIRTDEVGVAHLENESGLDVELPDGGARWTWSGSSLWIHGPDGSVALELDAEGRLVRSLTLPGWFEDLAASPDGRELAIAGDLGEGTGLYAYDLASGLARSLLEFSWSAHDPDHLQWSPDGRHLAALLPNAAGTARLVTIDLSSTSPAVDELDSQAFLDAPSWSSDGERLFWSADVSGIPQVRSWAVTSQTVTQVTNAPDGRRDPQVSPVGDRLAVLGPDGSLSIIELATGTERVVHDFGRPGEGALEWSRSGVLAATFDGEVRRYAPAGWFRHPGLALHSGVNRLTARATDPSGNLSVASQPIELELLADAAPDLSIRSEEVVVWPQSPVAGSLARVSVTVRNLAAVSSPASWLDVVASGSHGLRIVLAEGLALEALAPGAATTRSFDLQVPVAGGTLVVAAVVDSSNQVAELDESNNRGERSFLAGSLAGPAVAIATDQTTYAAGESVQIAVDLSNAGPTWNGRLVVTLEDELGFVVNELLDLPIVDLPYAGTSHRALVWPSGQTFAGGYQVRAALRDLAQVPVTEDVAAFTLGEAMQLSAAVETDRTAYLVGSPVSLVARVRYVAGNALLSGLVARLVVESADGVVHGEWQTTLGDLLPGDSASVRRTWSSSAGSVGPYRARVEVQRADAAEVSALSPFELLAAPPSFDGSLSLDTGSPAFGDPLLATWSVHQQSGAATTSALTSLTVVDAATGESLVVRQTPVSLSSGARVSGVESLATDELGSKTYLVVLALDSDGLAGPQPAVTLAVASFSPVDRTPPLLTVVRPTAGGLLGGLLEVAATAVDQRSTIDRVEAAIDGATWRELSLLAATSGLFGRPWEALAEGEHSLIVRAADAAGNATTSLPIAFTVDTTPPAIQVDGVADGGSYPPPVVPVISIQDVHLGWSATALDSHAFISGTAVATAGIHVLHVVAEDAAGNRSTASVSFSIGGGTEPALTAAKTWSLGSDADGDGRPSPGDTILFEVVVASQGTAPATGMTFLDPVPQHTTLVAGSVTTTVGAVTAIDPITVSLGALAPGESATVRFSVRIDSPLAAGVNRLVNQGSVSSIELPAILTDDPAVGGAVDPTAVPVSAAPRLLLEKSDALAVDADGDGVASPGDTLSYTLLLRNLGNTAATGLAVVDPIPSHTVLVAGSVTTDRGAITGVDPVTVAIESLPAGEVAAIRFAVQVVRPLPPGVVETANQGTATSIELAPVVSDDPETAETEDPTITTVSARPDLHLGKSDLLVGDADGDGFASPGDELLYVVSLTNSGNTAATAVVVTDSLPQETTLVPGSLQVSGGMVTAVEPLTLESPELAVGAELSASFRVRIADPFPLDRLEIANQAFAVAQGVAELPSDDPDSAATADPTRTEIRITPALAAESRVAGESEPTVVVSVSLSRPSNRPTTVSFATRDGSATAGLDYFAVSGRLTIPSGELSGAIAIPLVSDLLVEGDETFELVLSAPENGTLAEPRATITIRDDDTMSVATIEDATVDEGETAQVHVRLTPPPAVDVSFDFATVGGSATEGVDYLSTLGTRVVTAGTSEVVLSVATIEDALDEPAETFTVRLSSVQGAALGDGESSVTLVDDDGPPALAAAKRVSLALDTNGDGAANPGERLRYQVTIAALGGSQLSSVRFDDAAPDATTVVPGSVTTTAGSILAESPVQVAVGTLAPGASAEISFEVAIAGSVPAGTSQISNQGRVESAELPMVLTDDPTRPGSTDPTVIPLVGLPELDASKTDRFPDSPGAPGASAGEIIEYSVGLMNRGGGPAHAVRFEDGIPSHARLVSGSLWSSQGAVSEGDPIRVDVGDVGSGVSVEIRFRVRVDPALDPSVGEIVNQGWFRWGTEAVATDDPDRPGSVDPTSTPIVPASVLEIPTLNAIGAAAFSLLLVFAALAVSRRTRHGGIR